MNPSTSSSTSSSPSSHRRPSIATVIQEKRRQASAIQSRTLPLQSGSRSSTPTPSPQPLSPSSPIHPTLASDTPQPRSRGATRIGGLSDLTGSTRFDSISRAFNRFTWDTHHPSTATTAATTAQPLSSLLSAHDTCSRSIFGRLQINPPTCLNAVGVGEVVMTPTTEVRNTFSLALLYHPHGSLSLLSVCLGLSFSFFLSRNGAHLVACLETCVNSEMIPVYVFRMTRRRTQEMTRMIQLLLAALKVFRSRAFLPSYRLHQISQTCPSSRVALTRPSVTSQPLFHSRIRFLSTLSPARRTNSLLPCCRVRSNLRSPSLRSPPLMVSSTLPSRQSTSSNLTDRYPHFQPCLLNLLACPFSLHALLLPRPLCLPLFSITLILHRNSPQPLPSDLACCHMMA